MWANFTVHFTPEHGSRLNPTELGISRVVREALGRRRVGPVQGLKQIVRAWRQRANRTPRPIAWTFSRKKAREIFDYACLFKKRSKR